MKYTVEVYSRRVQDYQNVRARLHSCVDGQTSYGQGIVDPLVANVSEY